MNEMYKLMACWKSNGFIDTHCQEEINLFLDCASNQVFWMIFFYGFVVSNRPQYLPQYAS